MLFRVPPFASARNSLRRDFFCFVFVGVFLQSLFFFGIPAEHNVARFSLGAVVACVRSLSAITAQQMLL